MSQPHRNQSVVRQLTAFKSERLRITKPQCDSQVDVHYDLSKPVNTHYLPKEREAASAKLHHMTASSNSRISSKNMLRFSSNDMVHNNYLEEAKKKTQEHSRNSKPSLLPSARSQSTANGSTPKPRSSTQTSRNWPASKSSFAMTKTMPIAEHPRNYRNDYCVTKFLKEVNSRAKVPSNKTPKRNKPVEQISVPNEQERQIPIGNSTTKVDSKPLNGSNADITNQYECEQTLDGFKDFSSDVQAMTSDHNSLELRIHNHSNELSSSKLVPKVVPPADKTATSRQELEFLFHHHITMLRSYALSWKPCQGDSLNLPDYRYSIHTIKWETRGLDDGVAASFQQSRIHLHMLMLKLQRHTKHQDSRIKKAQTHRQSLSQTLINKIFLKISSLSKEILSKLSI
uniref:Integrase, catalytic region, zinc finger, CCHC-type, peptidase aspartic, catalytic n=1 Tax=Tanacetum cinerariifolium TaxID=118510 RepID=A0A6L2LDL6_TANCI|nr:hypothetical protein [Tanacetum cinerariifolium]